MAGNTVRRISERERSSFVATDKAASIRVPRRSRPRGGGDPGLQPRPNSAGVAAARMSCAPQTGTTQEGAEVNGAQEGHYRGRALRSAPRSMPGKPMFGASGSGHRRFHLIAQALLAGTLSLLLLPTAPAPAAAAFNGSGIEAGTRELSGSNTASSMAVTPCPNQDVRTRQAASLPDCRAFELVTSAPNDGDIKALCNGYCLRTSLNQAEVAGDGLTYSSYRAFAGALGAPWSNQYIARRHAGGWSTEAISPPKSDSIFEFNPAAYALEKAFKIFSSDLETGWLTNDNRAILTPSATPGIVNVYSRDNSSGAYTAWSTPNLNLTGAELEGASPDGKYAVMDQVEGAEIESNPGGLYEIGNGEAPWLINTLPGGEMAPGTPHLGAWPGNSEIVRQGVPNVANAVSADGSRVFWTDLPQPYRGGTGPLYMSEKGAPTIEIAPSPAYFRYASSDGARVFYEESPVSNYGQNATIPGPLKEFNLATQASRTVAGQAIGLVGASANGQIVYFVSLESLAAGAIAGEPNLYVEEDAGGPKLIATLARQDNGPESSNGTFSSPGLAAEYPIGRVSRVTPDGQTLAFQSTVSLTGYDNHDAVTGFPDTEVYVFDLTSEQLRCVSCNPSGARPVGQVYPYPYSAAEETYKQTEMMAAAFLNTTEGFAYEPRELSADGKRLYFNSFDSLVPDDTNGAQDVYEWEDDGVGTCERSEGCVHLISSGKSPAKSEFVDADASGANVFFETSSNLVGEDNGYIDIYDAREFGGFPESSPLPAPCQGEACQQATPGTEPPKPGTSNSFDEPTAHKRRCPRGKRAKGRRCLKGRHHSHRGKTKTKRDTKANGRVVR